MEPLRSPDSSVSRIVVNGFTQVFSGGAVGCIEPSFGTHDFYAQSCRDFEALFIQFFQDLGDGFAGALNVVFEVSMSLFDPACIQNSECRMKNSADILKTGLEDVVSWNELRISQVNHF